MQGLGQMTEQNPLHVHLKGPRASIQSGFRLHGKNIRELCAI